MTNRYRKTDWERLRRAIPPPIYADLAATADPPGFIAVRFGTPASQKWVEDRLGRGFRVLDADETAGDPRFIRRLAPFRPQPPPKDPE